MFGIKKLKEENKKLRAELLEERGNVVRSKIHAEENAKLKNVNNELVKRANKAEKQNREQTEADLYFVSAKIQKEILHGKKKEEIRPLLSNQNFLQEVLNNQRLGQAATPFGTIGGALSGYLGSL